MDNNIEYEILKELKNIAKKERKKYISFNISDEDFTNLTFIATSKAYKIYEQDKTKSLITIYKNILSQIIKDFIKKELTKGNVDLIISYLENELVNSKDQTKTLKEFFKHISSLGFNPSAEFYNNLIKRSKELKKFLRNIIDNNLFLIRKNNYKITSDEKINELLKKYIDFSSNNDELNEDGEEFNFDQDFEELNNYKNVLTKEQEIDLINRYRSGDKEALNILIEKNQGLINTCVHRYLGKGMEFEDLMQEGNIGLFTAIQLFDTNQGVKLSTYAIWYIRCYILRAIYEKGKVIRYPVYIHEELVDFIKVKTQFLNENEIEPTISELAKATNFSEEKIKLLNSLNDPTSLNIQIQSSNRKNTYELQDILPDEDEETIESIVENADLRNQLLRTIHIARLKTSLSEREEKIIRLRNGLDTGEKQTLQEVAKQFNVTRERIRQLEEKAYKKLERASVYTGLRSYSIKPNDRKILRNRFNINYDFNTKNNNITYSASNIPIDDYILKRVCANLNDMEKSILLLNLDPSKSYSSKEISQLTGIEESIVIKLSRKTIIMYKEALEVKDELTRELALIHRK